MDVEIFKFKATDGTHLDGFLNFNKNKSDSVIITVHGMASNCFKKREKSISQYAIESNIDTFIFNNRGSDIVRYLKKDYIIPRYR